MTALVQIVAMLCIVALCALLKFDGFEYDKHLKFNVKVKK